MNAIETLRRAVAVALAQRGLYFADLAACLGVAPTTLSSWMTGRHTPPCDLPARIEQALGMGEGELNFRF